jgi:hypothetical protein
VAFERRVLPGTPHECHAGPIDFYAAVRSGNRFAREALGYKEPNRWTSSTRFLQAPLTRLRCTTGAKEPCGR